MAPRGGSTPRRPSGCIEPETASRSSSRTNARAGDEVLERDGFELWVEAGLEGTVDVVEPHDRLILRSPSDLERSVEPH